MKITLASRALRWLADTFIGKPEQLFGLPPGSLADFWLLKNDRTLLRIGEPETSTWQQRRVFEVGLRQRIAMRVAAAATALASVVVICGLLALGTTTALHNAYERHHAEAAAEAAALSTARQQCESYKGQTLADSDRQSLMQQGCNPATGELDVGKFKAQMKAAQKGSGQ